MKESLNLDLLLGLSLDRLESVIEIQFGNRTLTIVDTDALPQKNKLMLGKANGQIMEHYKPIAEAEKKDGREAAIQVATSLMSLNTDLLEANILYLEAVAGLNMGELRPMLDQSISQMNSDRIAKNLPLLNEEQKQTLIPFFVARATALVRAALDDREKKFQERVNESVKVQSSEDPIDRIKALENPLQLPSLNSQSLTSATV